MTTMASVSEVVSPLIGVVPKKPTLSLSVIVHVRLPPPTLVMSKDKLVRPVPKSNAGVDTVRSGAASASVVKVLVKGVNGLSAKSVIPLVNVTV